LAKSADRPAALDARDCDGQTPLHHAARSYSEHAPAIVDLLLANGAAIDAIDEDGLTPLGLATYTGNTAIKDRLATFAPDDDTALGGGGSAGAGAKVSVKKSE
jgi:hypothetical protein